MTFIFLHVIWSSFFNIFMCSKIYWKQNTPMDQIPPWEVDNCLWCENISNLLWNPEVHYHVHADVCLIMSYNFIWNTFDQVSIYQGKYVNHFKMHIGLHIKWL
jgi:hypothetical protein